MLKVKSEIPQTMLLSLPNSGTDWLVNCICQSENVKYYREFFNPIVNPQFEDTLAKAFGCELADTIDAIATPVNDSLAKTVLNETWGKTDFNFTKENYSPFKLRFFNQFFECFVLHRDVHLCIPGSRREQVMTWYSALFVSVTRNSKMESVRWAIKHADTLHKKYVAAHVICDHQLCQDAAKLNISVLDYNDLMTLSNVEISDLFSKIRNFKNPDKIAIEIINSRRPKEKNKFTTEVDEFIEELVESLKGES